MRPMCLLAFFMLCFLKLLAQQSIPGMQHSSTPPLPSREVSGIVKDENGQAVPGAVVALVSIKDTLRTSTDSEGIFFFSNVKRATFLITVSGMGIVATTKKYFNNDLAKIIVLEPFELKAKSNMLTEVTINGKPSIVYKIDTIEFKASDYKVRENATVDEMLKKMEGMEVGKDGSLRFQGQDVKEARLNGRAFAGGNVAQAIKNLPADIIEKAQIIDDYGEQAEITGIKDGAPKKVLNLTTKSERSVGTLGRLTAQTGNQERYNSELFVQHINANRQIGFVGKLDNTVNGVSTANSGSRSGSPGNTRTGSPSFNYSDQWANAELLSGYAYRFNNNTSTDQSFGEKYSFGLNGIKNTSSFSSQKNAENDNKAHTIVLKLTYKAGKKDILQFTPNFNYSNFVSASNSLTDNINNFTTGFEHPIVKAIISNRSTSTSYGMGVLYRHILNKPRRSFSLSLNVKKSEANSTGDKNTDYRYYADSSQNHLIRDSLAHLLTKRTNNNTNYNATLTFVEPAGLNGLLQFREEYSRTAYDNNAIADTVLANGQVTQLYRLDNIFNYAFTELHLRINYTYQGKKLNFSAGLNAMPTFLAGTKLNNNNAKDVNGTHSYFRVIPVLSLNYVWSSTQRATLSYTGMNTVPDFQQIQPFTDRSDPNNIITGNPNLKPGFTNTISVSYNNYVPNSKLNTSIYGDLSTYVDQTTTNVVQHAELISSNPNKFKTINEVTFVNLNGAYKISGGHSISKQLSERRYSLSLNGNISYNYNVAMSNNVLFRAVTWRFNERFGPSLNPNENIQIYPYLAYDVVRTFTDLAGAMPTDLRTTSLNIDGKIYFLKTYQVNYSASKNFIVGLRNINSAPLVINAGVEKEFLDKKNLVFTFNLFDLLHQNNFTQQLVTPEGVTNTLSSTSSRYFLVGLRLILQKWGGTPTRNGKTLKRKGDGSFIY